jgi:hypothetical protein
MLVQTFRLRRSGPGRSAFGPGEDGLRSSHKTKAKGKHCSEFGKPLSNLYSLSGRRIEPILGIAIGYRKRGQTNERDD